MLLRFLQPRPQLRHSGADDVAEVLLLRPAEDEGITAIAALCALLVGTMSAVTITGPDCRIRRDVAACQFAQWMAAAVLPLQASLILTAAQCVSGTVADGTPPKVRIGSSM